MGEKGKGKRDKKKTGEDTRIEERREEGREDERN